MSSRANTNRLQTCNIFDFNKDACRLWSFNISGGQPALKESLAGSIENPPSAKCAEKGWSALWLQKLNVAWFPEDQVFLRVAHIPDAVHGELRAMIELQLEKLSPLPVAQVVWGFEVVPSKLSQEPGNLQTETLTGQAAPTDNAGPEAMAGAGVTPSAAPATSAVAGKRSATSCRRKCSECGPSRQNSARWPATARH